MIAMRVEIPPSRGPRDLAISLLPISDAERHPRWWLAAELSEYFAMMRPCVFRAGDGGIETRSKRLAKPGEQEHVENVSLHPDKHVRRGHRPRRGHEHSVWQWCDVGARCSLDVRDIRVMTIRCIVLWQLKLTDK